MSEYKKIPLLNICSLNNFPFIEADFDAVTYYQLLCKIVESVNSTITLANNLLDEYENFQETYQELVTLVSELQTRLDTIQEELTEYIDAKSAETKAELESEINLLSSELRTEVAEAIALVNSTLSEFRSEVNELTSFVRSEVATFKDYTDAKFNQLLALEQADVFSLQNQIDNLADTIPTVYNPATGLNESLQKALYDYWRLLREPYSLTASEYQQLELSAGEYQALNIKAIDYDLKAKEILI